MWFIYFQGKLDERMERVCLPIDIELKCNDMDSNGKVNFTIACNNVQCQQTFTIKKWTTSVMTNDSVKYNYTENCSTQPSVTTVVSTSISDTTMTTNSEREATPKATMCVTAMIGLGTVVSLLVVLVAVMTVGWVWTCWITKRRRGIIINSEQVR